jgi:SAM-dependent methyltransferase
MKKNISDFPVRDDYPGLQQWRCAIWNFSMDCFKNVERFEKTLEIGPSFDPDFSSTKILKNKSNCQIDTIGIDSSIKNLLTYFGSAESMEFIKNDSYDFIICTEVLEHIERPWLAAEEIYRITKNKGHILLTVPCNIKMHSNPYDFWRFINLESLRLLFSKSKNLEIVNSVICGHQDFPIGLGILLRKNENSH